MHGPHRTAPAAHYRDPVRHQVERRQIFGATWQFVGHERDLAHPGDVIAAQIAGFPILAVQTDAGVRAYHNVCRHRAGPLFDGAKGNCGQALTCKYHGWVYTLDGRLRNARDFGAVTGFDVRDFSLLPVRIESWRGFLFVNLSQSARPLVSHLIPLDARLQSRDLSALVPAGRKTHDIACNWKIYAENYLEGYHIPPVHPGLDAEIDSLKYQVTVEGDVCFHAAPLRDAAANAVYDGLWAFVSPNLGVNVYGHGLMMERIMPIGHDRTQLIYDYFLKPEIAADAAEAARIMAMSATVTAEDKWICEKVQENIDAHVYDTGVLSPRHEEGVAWFQRMTGAIS